jgi:hypothetical protein
MRRQKKTAAKQGLSLPELQMVELLEEMLETLRWQQILNYANQFLVQQKLKVEPAERDRILEAATRAVDRDGKLHEWQERIAKLKGEVVQIKRDVSRARRQIARGAEDVHE